MHKILPFKRFSLFLHILRQTHLLKFVMARVCGGIHRRCSSEMAENSDRPCLEQFHVLAVDDSFVDRMVIERLLKISSCKVTVVESGKRALQFLGLDEEKRSLGSNDLKVHLIITDYSMPGMTGYELLKKIKESSMFREVPVVIMSSENILTRIDRCLEEGAKEYLVKPVKLADVKRLKDFMMRGHSNGVKESSSSKAILQEIHDLSSQTTRPSTSSPRAFTPIILGYPCSSPKCVCKSNRSRFRCRSSKYQSELSLH